MKILTRVAPLFLLLAANAMSFAQASFTVYQTLTPTGDTTFNDVFEIAGSTGGDCYGAYGETTVAMALNNSPWFKLGTGFSDGVWIDLTRTWGITVPQSGEVDASYGINVTTQCLLPDAPIYYPGPSEDVFYLGTFMNGPPPATCLIPQTCPVPMPAFLDENGGWQTFFDWGLWVTDYIAVPNERISTSGATVTGCQKDDFGVYYGCLYSGTKPWCTPETYPPYVNVVAVANMDLYQNNPSTPWATLDMIKACFRSSGSGPWTCTGAYVYMKAYPAAPLGNCTSAAAMQ